MSPGGATVRAGRRTIDISSPDKLLFPAAGTNTVITYGDEPDEHLFDDCEVVATRTINNQRVAQAPMESRAAAAVRALRPVRSSLANAASAAWTRATPPPATMPSSTAAFALRTASSMRCLRSLSSTSVAAPTLITATPPASLARRSCSFSRS